MKLKHLLIAISAILILWFMYDSFSQPGPQDLKGSFKEVTMYRNENNTGPIIRVYAVTVADTLWEEMRQYGEYMPHNKYGNTKVYFFREGTPVPQELKAGENEIEPQFRTHTLARYEKDAMGQVSFRKHPFR